MFDATWESVSGRALPGWYDDAKLGIFVRWVLYSVPAWAPQVDDIQQLLRERGPRGMLRNNPYAEWYLNTMRIEGSPTQRHHAQTYGIDCPYDNFVEQFDRESSAADLDALASLCAQTGAGYVVLTTSTTTGSRCGPPGDDYREYATAHVRERIDRYGPSCCGTTSAGRRRQPGGVVRVLLQHRRGRRGQRRWAEQDVKRDRTSESLLRGAGELAQRFWRFVPDDRKELAFPGSEHYDFKTPEYAQFDTIVDEKWESTRGVGHSFAANRNERPEDIVTATELIRSFVDIVSKNGNC
ncbi:hypothetical protein GS539_21210 [Rhodococcus hoagii]|nr:hypothetical protein [Prescottella equi]